MTTLPESQVFGMPWEEFNRQWKWRQGEHVTLVGPTGKGKTSLELAILPRRDYVAFFSTKRIDQTQDALRKMGYKVIHDPRELHPEVAPHCILRPPWPDTEDADELLAVHRQFFRNALMRVFREGSWTVVLDELRYITKDLGLSTTAQLLYLQGRSLGVTMVGGTQRPRWIPLEAYDQADHLFFWRDPDMDNTERIAQLAGVNRQTVLETVLRLRLNEVLYVYTPTGEMVVTSGYQPYLRKYRY